MEDLARLGIAVDATQVDKAGDSLDNLTAKGAKAEAQAQRLTRTTQALGVSATGAAAKTALQRHELLNLGYQFQDIGVMLASGQNPFMIMAQQGSQVAQVLGSSGVGLGAVLKQLGGIVGGLVMRFWPLIAIAAAIGGAFALASRNINKAIGEIDLTTQMNLTKGQLEELKEKGTETGVTIGDTFKAVFQVMGRYIGEYVAPAWEKVKEWASNALDFVSRNVKRFIVFVVGGWLGMFNGIKAVWSALPSVIGDYAVQAANALIRIMERAANSIVNALVPFNAMLETQGIRLFNVDLPEIENQWAGAGDAAVNAFGQAFADGQSQAEGIVDGVLQDITDQAVRNAKERIRRDAGDPEKGRGSRSRSARESEYERAIKAAKEYIAALKQETEEIGKNDIELKMMEASRAAALAPTAALKAEILATAEAWRKATLAQRAAQADKEAATNLAELIGQLKFEQEQLARNAEERAVAAAMRELEAKGIKLTSEALKEELELYRQLVRARAIADEYSGLTNATNDNGKSDARSAVEGIRMTSGETLAERERVAYAEIERMRQNDIISFEEAERAKAMLAVQYNEQRLEASRTFFGNLATLQSSSNKTLQAIGKAAAIAQATIDGILAVQKALASYPPPVNYAMAAAVGVAAAANVAQIAGMANGGPVVGPGGPRDDKVLRWLSNGEFVVNSASAAANQELLRAINDNRPLPIRASNSAARPLVSSPSVGMGGLRVVIQNFGTDKAFDVQQISADEVRVIAKDVADKQIGERVPDIMGREVANPSSRFSKQLSQHTSAKRSRM